ncbi:MAG: LuxR C-terminal-related transcriptional regulator, partial [Thermomicrobiales bacterium]
DSVTTLTNLADTWHHLGDYTLANDLFAEAVSRFRNNGNRGSEGTCLSSYALLAVAESDFPRAASMLLESTRLVMEMGEQFTITENADLLAEIATAQGKYVAAIELLAGSDTLRRELGSAPKPVKQAQLARINQVLKRNVNDSLYRHHWLVGADLDLVALSRRIAIVARDIIGPKQIQPLLTEPRDATPAPSHSLTTRELQVLRLLTQGLSTREISEALYISPRTATTHINNIFGKLEVSSRAAAVAYAMRSGLA